MAGRIVLSDSDIDFTTEPAEPLGSFAPSGPGADAQAAVEIRLGEAEALGQALDFGAGLFQRLTDATRAGAAQGGDPQAWARGDLRELRQDFARLPPAAREVARAFSPVLQDGDLGVTLRGYDARAGAVRQSWQRLLDYSGAFIAAGGRVEAVRPALELNLAALTEAGLFNPDDPAMRQAMVDTLVSGQVRRLVDGDPAAGLAFLETSEASPQTRAQLQGIALERQRRHRQAKIAKDTKTLHAQQTAIRDGLDPGTPLTQEEVAAIYGPKEGLQVYRAYQAQFQEVPAWAAVRGRTEAEIVIARDRWAGDPALFDRVWMEDAAQRRADATAYAETYDPLLRDLPPEERQERLWGALYRQGTRPENMRPWSKARADGLAQEWLALPADGRARSEWFETRVLGLPQEQQEAAVRQLEEMGLDLGSPGRLRQAFDAYKDGNIGSFYAHLGAVSSEPPEEIAPSPWAVPLYTGEEAGALVALLRRTVDMVENGRASEIDVLALLAEVDAIAPGTELAEYAKSLLSAYVPTNDDVATALKAPSAKTDVGLFIQALEEGRDWDDVRARRRTLFADVEAEGRWRITDLGEGQIGFSPQHGKGPTLPLDERIATVLLEERRSADPKIDLLSRWMSGDLSNEAFLAAIEPLLPKKLVQARPGAGKAGRWIIDPEFKASLQRVTDLAASAEERRALAQLLVPTLFRDELSRTDWAMLFIGLMPVIGLAIAVGETAVAVGDLIRALGEGTPQEIWASAGSVIISAAGALPLGKGAKGLQASDRMAADIAGLSNTEVEKVLRSIESADDIALLNQKIKNMENFREFTESRENNKVGKRENKLIDAVNMVIYNDRGVKSYEDWMKLSPEERTGRVSGYQGKWTEEAAIEIYQGVYEAQGYRVLRDKDTRPLSGIKIYEKENMKEYVTVPDLLILKDGWKSRGVESEMSIKLGDDWINVDDIVMVYEFKSGGSKSKPGQKALRRFMVRCGRGGDYSLGNIPISYIGKDKLVGNMLSMDFLQGANKEYVEHIVTTLWFSSPKNTSEVKFITIALALMLSLGIYGSSQQEIVTQRTL